MESKDYLVEAKKRLLNINDRYTIYIGENSYTFYRNGDVIEPINYKSDVRTLDEIFKSNGLLFLNKKLSISEFIEMFSSLLDIFIRDYDLFNDKYTYPVRYEIVDITTLEKLEENKDKFDSRELVVFKCLNFGGYTRISYFEKGSGLVGLYSLNHLNLSRYEKYKYLLELRNKYNGLNLGVLRDNNPGVVLDKQKFLFDYKKSKKLYRIIGSDYSFITKSHSGEYGIHKGVGYIKEHYYICAECKELHRKGNRCDLGSLRSYGEGRSVVKKIRLADKSPLLTGREIEKEDELDRETIKKLQLSGFRAETDGSVDGGEYITPIVGINQVENFFKKHKYIFNNDGGSNCGGHVHISSPSINRDILYREMFLFRPLLWSIFPNRLDSGYCDNTADTDERYRDWNISNSIGTIELRIFPAVIEYKDVLVRTKLIKFMYENRLVGYNGKEDYLVISDLIKEKLNEIEGILLIRYSKTAVGAIIARIKKYYKLTK